MKTSNLIKRNMKATPFKGEGATPLGSAGYDNIRDDIEKVKQLRELKLAGRDIISTHNRTISVGTSGEFQSIQEAINQVPLILTHKYIINIEAGTYDEDLIIPPIITAGSTSASEIEGAVASLKVQGISGTATDLKIKSLQIITPLGASTPIIANMSITNKEPTSDENTAISVYGGGHALFDNIDFSENNIADVGIMIYGSSASVQKIILGNNKLDTGFYLKHGGKLTHIGGEISGSTNKYIFNSGGGGIATFLGAQMTATAGIAIAETLTGLIIDNDNEKIYNISKFSKDLDLEAHDLTTTGDITGGQLIQSTSSSTSPMTIKSTDGSDQIKIYHDNNNANFRTSDGGFQFITAEGTNTDTTINVFGKGAGRGYINLFDEDSAEYLQFTSSAGKGYISVGGTSASDLRLQYGAGAGVDFFAGAAAGETRELKIYGYRTGDASRSLQIGVGTDAADTASFDGVSNYFFDGDVEVDNTLVLSRNTFSDAEYNLDKNDLKEIQAYTGSGQAVSVMILTECLKNGRTLIFKDEGGDATNNNITITGEGGETFDGAGQIVIAANYGVVRLYSDGSNWFTF